VVLAAVTTNGYALEYASDELKADKEIVLAAVTSVGYALQYAADDLKADKEVVLAAVKDEGIALKFALGGLGQDPDCLKAAGFDVVEGDRPEKAVLSIKFGLLAESTDYSTEFAQEMSKDTFLQQFKTYNPTMTSKPNCREQLDYTSMDNHCRGTLESCGLPREKNLKMVADKEKPAEKSCWRFTFRFHQQESKDTGGFMIQVEELTGLGAGQKLETEMAREVGLKVFRTYTNQTGIYYTMGKISKAVEEWYESGCANTELENVFIGDTAISFNPRPKYEAL